MTTINQVLIEEYKIAQEYYLLALYTFQEKSPFEIKFKAILNEIKVKIKKDLPDFKFEHLDEIIKIDYKIFDIEIEKILRKDWAKVSTEEFNFIMHYCSGGAFPINQLSYIWDDLNRKNYMQHHGNDYHKIKRALIVKDILS